MTRPKIGWFLLLASLAVNVVLGISYKAELMRRKLGETALLTALASCELKREEWARSFGVAEQMDRDERGIKSW